MGSDIKHDLYRSAREQIAELVKGLTDPIAVMATCCAILHESLPYASWTGFYRVVAPDLLRVGPYQGSIGCLEIPFDNGVCGVAAHTRTTQIVPDVHRFPGHIACDPRTRSEIVVPVFDATGELVAVLDIDSPEPVAFDASDREGLEEIVGILSPHLDSP